MLTLLITAFVLGLVFNATPGPVFAETIRQGVRGGFRSALAVQLGSLVGDALWAVVGLVGVGLLLQLERLRTPISLASLVYLSWLAWNAWQASRGDFAMSVTADEIDHRGALRSGVLLSLTNPQNVAYWAALGSALGSVGVKAPTVSTNLVFFLGFMASSIVWAFLVAALVDRAFRRVGARWARLTYRACAIAFMMLALSILRQLWASRQPSAAIQWPGGDVRQAFSDH
jgi:chemosensory pili system protein ChpE